MLELSKVVRISGFHSGCCSNNGCLLGSTLWHDYMFWSFRRMFHLPCKGDWIQLNVNHFSHSEHCGITFVRKGRKFSNTQKTTIVLKVVNSCYCVHHGAVTHFAVVESRNVITECWTNPTCVYSVQKWPCVNVDTYWHPLPQSLGH